VQAGRLHRNRVALLDGVDEARERAGVGAPAMKLDKSIPYRVVADALCEKVLDFSGHLPCDPARWLRAAVVDPFCEEGLRRPGLRRRVSGGSSCFLLFSF
jgi:hypothetical protein